MADGDQYHNKIKKRYQRVYRQLGEGQLPTAVIAFNVLKPLRKTLICYGNSPLSLLIQAADIIYQNGSTPMLSGMTNWDSVKDSLEVIARQLQGNRRGIGLAWQVIEDHCNFPSVPPNSHTLLQEMINGYFWKTYVADFDSRIRVPPNASVKPVLLPHNEVVENLNGIRSSMEDYLQSMANQAARIDNIDQLRLPRKPQQPDVDMDEDLGFGIGLEEATYA